MNGPPTRDSWAEFVRAVERTVAVQKITDTKLRATCPACRRKHKLHAAPSGGKVVFTPHCGCDRDAVLDLLGLSWADLYDERSYIQRDPHMSPSRQVRLCLNGSRIPLPIHRSADESEDTRLAIRAIELTLFGRYQATIQYGLTYRFDRFPLVNDWIAVVLGKDGIEVTDRQLRRVGRIARGLLVESGGYSPEVVAKSANWVLTFTLSRKLAASLLRSAQTSYALATASLLTYTQRKSSPEAVRINAFREALERIRDPLIPTPEVVAGNP